MGLTEACRQLRGEGGRPRPAWASFLSSQRLKLRAESCRELELPERSEDTEITVLLTFARGAAEDKHVTGSQTIEAQQKAFLPSEDTIMSFRFHPKFCWRPGVSVQELEKKIGVKGGALLGLRVSKCCAGGLKTWLPPSADVLWPGRC